MSADISGLLISKALMLGYMSRKKTQDLTQSPSLVLRSSLSGLLSTFSPSSGDAQGDSCTQRAEEETVWLFHLPRSRRTHHRCSGWNKQTEFTHVHMYV